MIGLYSDIGLCYREQGDYNSGIKYGRRSIQLAEANLADTLQLTGMQGTLSSIYEKNQQPDSSSMAQICSMASRLGYLCFKILHASRVYNFIISKNPYLDVTCLAGRLINQLVTAKITK